MVSRGEVGGSGQSAVLGSRLKANRECKPLQSQGFPHPRGDGPTLRSLRRHSRAFSPPAWGWSAANGHRLRRNVVFPTRVGMVRDDDDVVRQIIRFPHPRGDGPFGCVAPELLAQFSPPAWGWSVLASRDLTSMCVFPTRVGMVRCGVGCVRRRTGFPHPRGDGPCDFSGSVAVLKFSPPAWGWSAELPRLFERECVFPTRVGMVRRVG